MSTASMHIPRAQRQQACALLCLFLLITFGLTHLAKGQSGTNAALTRVASSTNAPAPATNAPVPPQQPDSVAYPPGANAGNEQDLTWPIPARTMENLGMTNAPTPLYSKPTNDELINNVAHNKVSINLLWTLVTGFLVMFMQAGFALVETGLCRAKNAAHVMAMNFMIYGLGMLGFWICGFAIMFGGYYNGPVAIGWQPSLGQGLALLNVEHGITIGDIKWGFMGGAGFFLNPS